MEGGGNAGVGCVWLCVYVCESVCVQVWGWVRWCECGWFMCAGVYCVVCVCVCVCACAWVGGGVGVDA